jgi:multidrug efflux pump
MIISDIAVKRPVFATVISLLLIAFGLVSFDRLSLREYPDIDAPIVTVEVEYPGAPANIVESRVTEFIEERIAGVAGIDFVQSVSKDGQSKVTIQFLISRDINAAANDIRDRISGIQDNLPEAAEPPEVQKIDSNDDVVIWQNLSSDRLSLAQLTDYAERFLVDQYSSLEGVARVRVGGGLRYAMRVWLDRKALAARNLTALDVEVALRSENVELPAGSLQSDERIFKARVERNFKTPADFSTLVLARGEDGYLVRLGDVARVEKGVEEDRTIFRGNGIPMVGIGVIKQSTANTIEVSDATKSLTASLNINLPEGMTIAQSYDAAVFIKASIKEVYKTLFISLACVVLVIFIFLGSVRAMLIPAVTVPISIFASFIVIYVLGFTINLLTLLALVLAIGLVVDDAIVMLENIVRRIQEKHETPLVAAFKGARQVGFAIIATTLVLISVFIPITFLEGDIGRLFTEFAITISAAVVFSSLVALTLVPVLASKLLKKSPPGSPGNSSSLNRFSELIDALKRTYISALVKCIRYPILVVTSFAMLVAGVAWLYPQVTQEFTPREDRGAFFLIVNGPEGASFSYIEEYMTEIEARLAPYVETGEFKRLLIRAPRGFGNIESFNTGFAIVLLDDWANRRSAFEIMNEVRGKLADLSGVRAFPVMRQGLGGGPNKPVQFVLGGSTYDQLAQWRDIILEKVAENNPGFLGLDSDYKQTRPQLDFIVNYNRAADLGVSISDIGQTLETLMGGRKVTTFLDNGEEYDVIVEGEASLQTSFSDIESIYVRSDRTGQLIPMSNLLSISEYGAAEKLSRYNRIRAITLTSNLEDGYALSDALDHLETLTRRHLPEQAIIDYKGQSRDFVSSGSSIVFVFILGLAIVFLVLAAQFESFIHPLVIMLTVPLAAGGGLLGLYLTGGSLNIYSQIGLIILVGLAAKNGILIVEFANQLRDQGVGFARAIVQASDVRFRPILMTGLTTVAGAIPLIITSGAGAETRISIGIVVLCGVISATIFTLFIVPIAYSLVARNTGSPNAVSEQLVRESSRSGKR